MKNVSFFILAILALLAVSLYFNARYFTMKKNTNSLEVPVNEMKAINRVLDNQLKAWNNGSIDGFMEGYWKSDSFRFISKRGVENGWNTLINKYKTSYNTKEKMGKLIFHRDGMYKMSDEGQEVLLVGRWEVQKKDTAMGTFALIMKEINGDWKIIQDHTY